MDDPWAAPAWSTPAKPSSSSPPPPRGLSLSPPRPQATFDVSDPWGAPLPAIAAAPSKAISTFAEDASESRPSAVPTTPGWGHEPAWDASEAPAPAPPEPLSPTPASRGITRLDQSPDMPSWGGQEATLPSSPPPKLSFESARPAQTPPRPFPSLPDFASPHSPLSHHSPFSHRSMTPTISQHIDDEDPETAFAAALPQTYSVNDLPKFDMPKSPSFGEGDFGGFSSGLGDPWGGGEKVGWCNEEREEQGGKVAGKLGETEDSGDGWGLIRPAHVEKAPESSEIEQDWEAAQRKIQLQESLIPRDKLERIKMGWKEVASGVIGLGRLPEPTADEAKDLEAALRRLEIDRYVHPSNSANISDEILRSLASIPSDINTYPPVLSAFTTHTTYLSSLSRPNPAPSTSFLITSAKRPRHTNNSTEPDKTSSWLSRSRLGEPEIAAGDSSAPVEQEGKSRWAFWGRRPQPERQLTTSGGGVLEKKVDPAGAASAGELRKSTSQQFGSVPMTGRSSLSGQQSPSSSRRGSVFELPAPGDLTSPHTPSTANSPLSSTHAAQPAHNTLPAAPSAAPVAAAAPAGPSAVSRFFGRLRRNPSSGPLPDATTDDLNAKDLELGEDDFSFLGQVPSLSYAPDLLDQHHKPDHEMASLESMIASTPTPLPPPLAPPPIGSGAAVRAGVRRNDMDLLSGLYDEDDESSVGGDVPNGAGGDRGKTDPIGWDAFLGPSPAAATKSTSTATTPQPKLPALPPPAPLPASRPPIAQTPSTDFDDFGTPQKAQVGFDDFADFSAFETTPSPPSPPPPPRFAAPPGSSAPPTSSQRIPFFLTPAQPPAATASYTSPLPLVSQSRLNPTPSNQTHGARQSLDHTPTLNLVNDASTTKGKRWPAPPSPDMPGLPPPPGAVSGNGLGGGFPFLSPPPPPKAGSRAGMQMRDMLSGDTEMLNGGNSSIKQPVQGMHGMQQQLMSPASVGKSAMMPTPLRTATPASKETVQAAVTVEVGGGQSLSAQDLSFFDNL